MVHHIVMWKFKPEIPKEDQEALKAAMAENLKSLVGKVSRPAYRGICEQSDGFQHP